MASIKERLAEARQRSPFLDHVLDMQEHYSEINGSAQAASVTYFGFLSFFPILALAFFVVGYVAKVYSGAQDNLITAMNQVLPGMIGTGDGQIKLTTIQSAAGAVGLIGLVGVVYAGLGWLSGMRNALDVTFVLPTRQKPNFIVGKLRDLITLVAIGLVLVASVAISGVVASSSGWLLDLVGLGRSLSWLLRLLGPLVGLAANMLLFFTMFKLLADPPVSKRRLWEGALFGSIGFEILKQASSYLIASTKNQPAFQAFGIALILVVWINYFSRVVVYAASWSYTADARDLVDPATARSAALATAYADPGSPGGALAAGDAAAVRSRGLAVGAGAGAAAMLGLVAVVRRVTRG